MRENVLETSTTPVVVVSAHGRVYIRGWDRNEVRVNCADESGTLEELDGQIHVHCADRLDLRVPQAASLIVTALDDATIRDVAGSIKVEQVSEDLALRNVGETEVSAIGSDLVAKSVAGSLSVVQVGGSVNVKDVSGALRADFVAGHANLVGVDGDVKVEAAGNAVLSCSLSEAQQVYVKCDGVITCRVAPGIDGRVHVKSFGPISVRIKDVQAMVTDGEFDHVFGEGQAVLNLTANGPVTVLQAQQKDDQTMQFDFTMDETLGDLGAGISEQISEQLSMIGEELEERMSGFSDLINSAGLSAEKAARIEKRTQEKIIRAQEKIRRAQERASRKIASAQRRAQSRARRAERIQGRAVGKSWSFDLDSNRGSQKPKAEPVSDEERMMILNMLAEKKISLEEAESLLAALEGK